MRLNAEKLLGDGNLDPDDENAVLVQLEELSHINQMIDELLFISRAEAHTFKLKLVANDPEVFLLSIEQDALALTAHKGKRLLCRHRGHGRVAMEKEWLRRLIFNLLVNALHISPPGGLIRINSVLGSGTWRLSVQDEGPGLTDTQCEQAFDRFVRFNVPSGEDRGSGLGLAICRSIINLHGGRIYARSLQYRRGLRVTFELPTIPDTAIVA